MKKAMKEIIIGLLVLIIGISMFYFYTIYTTPIPEYFNVIESPIEIKINEEIDFVKDYYPDEAYSIFKCVCEDSSIAKVKNNKEVVVGLKEGKTKIECTAKDVKLVTLDVVVKSK